MQFDFEVDRTKLMVINNNNRWEIGVGQIKNNERYSVAEYASGFQNRFTHTRRKRVYILFPR